MIGNSGLVLEFIVWEEAQARQEPEAEEAEAEEWIPLPISDARGRITLDPL